jgi:NADH dehydrogenase
VEVAGAMAGLKKRMPDDFRRVRPSTIRIILCEALDHILDGYSPALSARGKRALEDLGVEVRLNTRITDINEGGIRTESEFIATENVVWAAGFGSQPFTQSIGAQTDKTGRVLVDVYCNISGHPEVFVIGDAAAFMDAGKPLPALAPVATQQASYVAGIIKGDFGGKTRKPFKYKSKGLLTIIGRHKALLQSGKLEMSGYPAWLVWVVLHFAVISKLRNRALVLAQWLFYYTTRRRGIRLITGQMPQK